MRHLDLFSGIGGFALAAQMVWGDEYENVGFCDNNEFCQQIIKKHWPSATIYEDIRNLKPTIGTADLITGGFPCQPFSDAGKKKGKEDDRYLWPEMLRVIREVRPSWVVGENVAGIVRMEEFEIVCSDLESEGYEVQPFIIPACAVGAPHRRDRVWIVAHSNGDGEPSIAFDENERQGKLACDATYTTGKRRGRRTGTGIPDGERLVGPRKQKGREVRSKIAGRSSKTVSYTDSADVQGGFAFKESNGIKTGTIPIPELWETTEGLLSSSVLCRTDDGIPDRVDRTQALGNAIVPQVAMEIFRAIKRLGPVNAGPRK